MYSRHIFSNKLTVEEFKKHYWYKTELQDLCRHYHLPYRGTKVELENILVNYLAEEEKNSGIFSTVQKQEKNIAENLFKKPLQQKEDV